MNQETNTNPDPNDKEDPRNAVESPLPRETAENPDSNDKTAPWYAGVTGYQWMVLAIASAGWVFDVFEGQLFGSLMHKSLDELLAGTGFEQQKEMFSNLGLGAFLAGGAAGGLLFGMLADRWGRKQVMAFTILMYSLFTGLTALSQTWWHLIGLRFLVGMGVGGEWAVAAALVAEVFPKRARPAASGIFHASSVLGTYMAVGVGLILPLVNWRFGFLVGVVPALLILWVRVGVKEPESWETARKQTAEKGEQKLGRFSDLFSTSTVLRNTVVATSLAIIGLATFWGAHFRGRDIVRNCNTRDQLARPENPTQVAGVVGMLGSPVSAPVIATTTANASPEIRTALVNQDDVNFWGNVGWFLVTTGGGIGLLTFGPLSQRIGRRSAFFWFHIGAFALATVVFFLTDSLLMLMLALPIFGFFTLAMHAGYAVYFPELYPTRLRSTGIGFCFNMARVVVVPVLLLFAWLQNPESGLGFSLSQAMLVLSVLFLVGAGLSVLGPETRGRELPE